MPVAKGDDRLWSRQSPPSTGSGRRDGEVASGSISELCKSWPRRWDKYVLPTCYIQSVFPDPRLSSNPTPCRLLLGRDARTQLDSITPVIDGVEF